MQPFLSVLIPSCAYPEGVERILSAVGTHPDVEILIFDDTPGPEIERLVSAASRQAQNVVYRHNPTAKGQALGAVSNWNELLDAARGTYIHLIHHDEVPLGADFVARLGDVLNKNGEVDVVLMDLLLVNEELHPIRRHVPTWFRELVCRHAPGYLFRRNVIGPTAALIIKRSRMPRFDVQLKWLVDVELYVRLCRSRLKWITVSSLQVGSLQRSSGSITASLRSDLSAIDEAERHTLSDAYARDRTWLGSRSGKPVRAIEALFWLGLRAVTRGLTKVSSTRRLHLDSR